MLETRARRTIHEGRKFDYEEVTLVGRDGAERTRQYVRHPGAVCVCPILEEGGAQTVVFIRNERFAIGETLLELAAGTIDPGEAPDACARRELIEETGYEASELIPLGSFYTTPGMTDELMHAYAARGLTHVGQRLEAEEEIEVELVPASEALRRLDAGELMDAKSIVTLVRAMRRGLVGV
jgi:ADP-ribose pyrophosphatase